jgi:hypothetical protein
MADQDQSNNQGRRFLFPRWSNLLLPALVVGAIGGPAYLGLLVPLALSPTTLNVGYRPEQPVDYSHQLHVSELGIDCRYCHSTVEEAAFAAIPPTSTCMNCHQAIRSDSAKLLPVRESYETGEPIPWVKVHDLPDYAYFNHSVHVKAGVSCVECHGRVDKMDEQGVYTVENLSMSWCLECHRNPEPHLRPREFVTQLDWTPPGGMSQLEFARQENLMEKHDIPSRERLTDCSTCHR